MSLPLTHYPALEQPDLLAPPVAAALRSLPWADQVRVAAIDPALADTAQFCETYGVSLEESANCVIIAAKRGSAVTFAACLVTATTRADVNGLVRRHLGAKKASFGPMDTVTSRRCCPASASSDRPQRTTANPVVSAGWRRGCATRTSICGPVIPPDGCRPSAGTRARA